jgi:hypothetical protein
MEIVLGAFRFADPAGTEHYTLTVAEQLQRLGHEVTIYVEQTGEISDLARSRGLRLATGDDELPDQADVLYAQESVTAYALAARYAKAPLAVAVHSVDYDLSVPPQLPELVSTLVTLNERVTRRAEAFALDTEIVRLRQPVDISRFSPRGSLREPPQRVLALGNYLRGDRAGVIEAACAEAGLEAVSVGMHRGNRVLESDRVLNEADVVLGKGRVIVEAMACGRAAYVFDLYGSGGWVTNDSYAGLEADNFAGLTSTPPVDVAQLTSDLELYRTDMGAANRELAVVHHSANKHAMELVELFERLAPRPAVRTAPLREMARLVRVQWQSEERAVAFGLEAGDLRDQLEASRRRIDELELLAARLPKVEAELDAARVGSERRVQDLLRQRRVRLGIALAWPLDLLRRRRR